jgi:hypothetical protein
MSFEDVVESISFVLINHDIRIIPAENQPVLVDDEDDRTNQKICWFETFF